MASNQYNYFIGYQIQEKGRILDQKNAFIEVKKQIATEQDVRRLVKDLENDEMLKFGQRIFLVSFTQLTGGIEH